MFKVPNEYRMTHGKLASDNTYGCNGAFIIPLAKYKARTPQQGAATVIVSDGGGWEHVSVHVVYNKKMFTPCWATMCVIKDLFWDDEDCVIQFHPPKSQYVNMHPHVLHLWRKVGSEFETPPKVFVGI